MAVREPINRHRHRWRSRRSIVDKQGFITPSTDAVVKHLASDQPPAEARFFAKRMKATTTELNMSHVPMLSKPNDVAVVIMGAAATAPQ